MNYLAAILDVYTRKIVGWSMNKNQTHELVKNALLHAIMRQKVKAGIIFRHCFSLSSFSNALNLKPSSFFALNCPEISNIGQDILLESTVSSA